MRQVLLVTPSSRAAYASIVAGWSSCKLRRWLRQPCPLPELRRRRNNILYAELVRRKAVHRCR